MPACRNLFAAVRDRPSEKSRAPAKIALRLAVAGFILMLAGCGIHTDYFETRAFEVTVDLTAEGQRMQITKVIECEPWRRREAGLIPYTQWRAKTRSFGRRLPSGAAVLIATPSFCRSAYRKEGSTGDDLPIFKGYVPYIGWTDNPDNPTVVEAYVSQEYFERPYARVIYHGMTARIASTFDSNGSDEKQFGWFENWDDITGESLAFGLYARIIPREVWREVPELARYVVTADRPQLLPRELTIALMRYAGLDWGKDRARKGLGLRSGPSPDITFDKSADTDAAAAIHPIVRLGKNYQISTDQRGLIAFYRIGLPNEKVTDPRPIILETGREQVELPVSWFRERTLFDPNSQTMYQIMAGLPTRFPTRNN